MKLVDKIKKTFALLFGKEKVDELMDVTEKLAALNQIPLEIAAIKVQNYVAATEYKKRKSQAKNWNRWKKRRLT